MGENFQLMPLRLGMQVSADRYATTDSGTMLAKSTDRVARVDMVVDQRNARTRSCRRDVGCGQDHPERKRICELAW